ncbi:rhodanese domain-containing protein CG4456-like isoform X2 [Rhynchophorus ferrugineus]
MGMQFKECGFETISKAIEDGSSLVIDVRQPEELIEMGKIEGAINIPLDQVEDALGPDVTNEEFKKLYSVDKPDKNTPIIFTCRSGRRSGIAQKQAINLGFSNVTNYIGGWLDWASKFNKTDTY